MNAYIVMGITLAVLFIVMFAKEYFDYKDRTKKAIEKTKNAYGKYSDKKFTDDELNNIKKFFYRYAGEDSIDDITARDLSLDEIFVKYNNCLSAPGKEYFYYLLRSPEFDKECVEKLENKVDFFSNNEKIRNEMRADFYTIGNMRKVSFLDCIDYFEELKGKNLAFEYLVDVLLIAFIVLIGFVPAVGIVLLIAGLCFNIVTYYRERGAIDSYIICFGFIANFLSKAKVISEKKIPELEDEISVLREKTKDLSAFERMSGFVTGRRQNIGAGNPLDILGDYIKMIFHIDVINFYKMLKMVQSRKDELEEIYIILGKLETYINIASIRAAVPFYCIPERGEGLCCVDIYHPLVDDPVVNSMSTDGSVLITGSNASGKSTFLKAVAINAIFAKTINTCLAREFVIDDYHVFSSMSLSDDIINKNSYFMVEIKALKRIFDYHKEYPDKKVLCFVDEVLRGTNTIERIAAVTEILKNLGSSGIMCFAATHDIELTDTVADLYSNYHFDEEIKDNDILFNYLIKPGKATSRNAIKLLSIMGFEDEIVSKAEQRAKNFMESGNWC